MWDRETKEWSVLSHHISPSTNHSSLPSIHSPISAFQLTSNSGLVDFEMWDPYPESNKPDPNDPSKDPSAEESLTELRKWGLAHKPPAKNWWAEFGIVTA